MIKKIFLNTAVFLFLSKIILHGESHSFNALEYDDLEFPDQEEMFSSIDDFISLPKGGTSWGTFGETGMDEYSFIDKEGNEWFGYRPLFKENIKKLESKKILVQGYMFPLDQSEKQSLFLLGPFPMSCPYHPHTSSNLTIEVSVKKPVKFSYEPVNIRGTLELVPKDDLYNIFFRLKNAELVEN